MNQSQIAASTFLVCTGLLVGCADSSNRDAEVFTLYTNAPSDEAFRFGIATFDASGPFPDNNEFRNQKYCNEAAAMFQAKWEQSTANLNYPGANKVRHWCEKGRFRK